MPAQKRSVFPASPAAAGATAAADSSPPSPSTAEKHQAEDPAPPPPQQEVKTEAENADVVDEQEDEHHEPRKQQEEVKDEEEQEVGEGEENQQPGLPQERQDDSEGGGGSGGGDFDLEEDEEDEAMADDDRLIPVRLADIRKEVQCPICLGIIRKTRTVMECLHRFCRECIDKSMRLGNNECPACRTHCASRRSLRDDSNYDFFISAIYTDIDKYEEEEFAFREEEKSRNKKIQATISETFRRQAEALGRKRYTEKTTAAAFVRRSQGNYKNNGQNSYFRGRGRNYGREASAVASDDDNELEANADDGSKESSADEPSPERRQKRCKRWGAPRSSPARVVGNIDAVSAENDDIEVNKETIRTSPLHAGERLSWGKNGTRSQTRHGNIGGSAGRMVKGRMTRLVDHLRNLDQTDQLDVHLVLIPVDDKSNLEQPYVCCQPTMSIRHICEFIALQASVQAEEVQLYAKQNQGGTSMDITRSDHKGDQVLEEQVTLGSLVTSYTSNQGELVLFYNLKMPS